MAERSLSWEEALELGLSNAHIRGVLPGVTNISGIILQVIEEDRHIVFTLDKPIEASIVIMDGQKLSVPKTVVPIMNENGALFMRIGMTGGLTVTLPVTH